MLRFVDGNTEVRCETFETAAVPLAHGPEFPGPWRRYSSPRMNAVSTVASALSKRAISVPSDASMIRTWSPVTCPKVPPSAEAATTTRSMAGSTRSRSTARLSVTPSATLRLPS